MLRLLIIAQESKILADLCVGLVQNGCACGLRVSQEEERIGLDYREHAVNSYPDFGDSSVG